MNKIIKNYRDNEHLRNSFNELAKKTFGIDFEDWYQNGYWTDRYNPYSIIIDGEVAANVSVNTTDYNLNGAKKKYIQLGTVMTEEKYRNQGLIREIMQEIEKDYAGKVDGMYLFANNEVLSFYPKFGFQVSKQYEYYKKLSGTSGDTTKQLFEKVLMADKKAWDMLETKIKTSFPQSSFEILDNSQLNMFYVSKYMQENVYYSGQLNTYVIAEADNATLVIYMVISDTEQDLNHIVQGFGEETTQVVLGFTPRNPGGFASREMDDDGSVLFVKGEMKSIEELKLMFPLLAHA